MRKTHSVANFPMNMIVFFPPQLKTEKERISISMLIHIYIEMNPDANKRNGVFLNQVPDALRNEQATPRGISKYVEHISHFGSSKNDGSIQNAETTTQINLEKFALSFALLDLWRNKGAGFQNTLTAYRIS